MKPQLAGLALPTEEETKPSVVGLSNGEGDKVRVLKSLDEAESVRTSWLSWSLHPNSHIDFYEMVVRAHPQVLRPHVIVRFKNSRPDCLLAGRIETSCFDFRLGYHTFFQIPVRQLTLIYTGALGDLSTANCRALVDEVLNTLRRSEADIAFFNCVRTDSDLYRAICTRPSIFSRDRFGVETAHRTTTLPNRPEEIYDRLSSKVRKNLKWQAKKLVTDAGGEVQIRTFRGLNELDELMSDAERVATKTYQRGLGVGFVNDGSTRERLALEAQNGWLRGRVLYLSSTPAAFWIGGLFEGTFHSYFMGYDPAHAKYSPGMYLIMKTIESFGSSNGGDSVERIDWGLGDAQYKDVLGDCCWKEVSLYIFAPTFKGFWMNAIHTPFGVADKFLRDLLRRTNLLQRVKKMWRDRVRAS